MGEGAQIRKGDQAGPESGGAEQGAGKRTAVEEDGPKRAREREADKRGAGKKPDSKGASREGSGSRGGQKKSSVTAEVMREELHLVVERSLEAQTSSASGLQKLFGESQTKQTQRFDHIVRLTEQSNIAQKEFQDALLQRLPAPKGSTETSRDEMAGAGGFELDVELREWLARLNYSRFVPTFEKHQTTFEELPYMDFELLKDMGIPGPAAKRMEAEIQKLAK
jgi:hypothetical protein